MKRKNTKKNKKTVITKEEIADELTEKHKLFVELYLSDRACFGNATVSYRTAYNLTPKQYKSAQVSAHRLLRNDKILKYKEKLLKEWFTDESIDNELAKLVAQDKDLVSKNMAIKEVNKLKNRIVERVDHTTMGKEIKGINYIKPNGNNPRTIIKAR